jgi:hypothetical protein
MIVLVLILVPVVTINLMNQLPEDRIPTVNILMKVNPDNGEPESVALYHKGGDYIKKDDISLVIRIKSLDGTVKEIPWFDSVSLYYTPSVNQVFDLGDYVKTGKIEDFADLQKGSVISVALLVKNSIIFTGDKIYE